MELTVELLAELTRSTLADAAACLEPIQHALAKYEINTPTRVAAFLATVAVESMNLSKFEEALYYKDAVRVATIFKRVFDTNKDGRTSEQGLKVAAKYTRNARTLSDVLYGGYHCRGPIQLTWKKNYQAFEDDTGIKCVSDAERLLDLSVGFEAAGWFCFVNGCNEAADSGSMRAVTKLVNGPALMHLAARTELFDAAFEALPASLTSRKG
jgi:putative chitinase